ERTPLWDTKAKGAFLGIKKDHTYLHLLKAVLEGVAFSIADIIFKAEKLAKVKVNEVRVSGGGSKSDIWNQIKADVLNIPVSRIKITETALLGSAILAAVGVKFFKSIKEAKDSMVKIDHRYQPNQENHLSYSRIFKLYKKSYISLKDIFHELDQKGVNGE
ncbi:MAG: xylulokinase, partial [Deltaproteobacteria bacterium]|nr:xylulokinase [Deltaproteobacteria bacterium]